MTDAQVAKMFVYVGDGLGVNTIVSGSLDRIQKELIPLWEGLYKMLSGRE